MMIVFSLKNEPKLREDLRELNKVLTWWARDKNPHDVSYSCAVK